MEAIAAGSPVEDAIVPFDESDVGNLAIGTAGKTV